MAENSKIEWCDHTLNPWRGCTKVSPGCANCYAATMSKRNPATLGVWSDSGTRVVASEAQWKLPLKWNREAACCCRKEVSDHEHEQGCPQRQRPRVFCGSLMDVMEDWRGPMVDAKGQKLYRERESGIPYGESFPRDSLTMNDVRRRLFSLIDATQNIDYLLVTKRPENAPRLMPGIWCGSSSCRLRPESGPCRCQREPRHRANVWFGTSVENRQHGLPRIDHLRRVPAAVRFLSIEPLLEDLGVINLDGIHWVIVGGESGHGARPCHPDWVRSIRDQCVAAGVPFFFKQWGEWAPKPCGDWDSKNYHWFQDGECEDDGVGMWRVGKRAAGRLLDGRTWDEFPKGVTT